MNSKVTITCKIGSVLLFYNTAKFGCYRTNISEIKAINIGHLAFRWWRHHHLQYDDTHFSFSKKEGFVENKNSP